MALVFLWGSLRNVVVLVGILAVAEVVVVVVWSRQSSQLEMSAVASPWALWGYLLPVAVGVVEVAVEVAV